MPNLVFAWFGFHFCPSSYFSFLSFLFSISRNLVNPFLFYLPFASQGSSLKNNMKSRISYCGRSEAIGAWSLTAFPFPPRRQERKTHPQTFYCPGVSIFNYVLLQFSPPIERAIEVLFFAGFIPSWSTPSCLSLKSDVSFSLGTYLLLDKSEPGPLKTIDNIVE